MGISQSVPMEPDQAPVTSMASPELVDADKVSVPQDSSQGSQYSVQWEADRDALSRRIAAMAPAMAEAGILEPGAFKQFLQKTPCLIGITPRTCLKSVLLLNSWLSMPSFNHGWIPVIMDNSYPRQLVPKTTRTQDNSYPRQLVLRTTRTQDNSYPRRLVPKTTRTQYDSYPGRLVPKTTRTQDNSYPGRVLWSYPKELVVFQLAKLKQG